MARGIQPSNADLANIVRTVIEGLQDVSGPVAMRAAGSTLPLAISANNELTINIKNRLSPVLTDAFVSLLVVTKNVRIVDTNSSRLTQLLYERLGSSIAYFPLLKAMRAALRASLPLSRIEKVEEIRRCMQAISDTISNSIRSRPERNWHLNYIWSDINQFAALAANQKLSTARPAVIEGSLCYDAWQTLRQTLIAFDDSWMIWIYWYEYRFLGRESSAIPSFLWPNIEQRFCDEAMSVWPGNSLVINKALSECCTQEIEAFLDLQSNAPQRDGATKFLVEDRKIDVYEETQIDESHLPSVANELLRKCKKFVEDHRENSAALVRENIQLYIDNFSDDGWTDDAILVLRGNDLRTDFSYQSQDLQDTDIPIISASAKLALEGIVTSHNLLINISNKLTTLDRQLNNLGENSIEESINSLNGIIDRANQQLEMTDRARAALSALADRLKDNSKDEKARLISALAGIGNFLQATFSYAWKNRKSIGTLAGTTGFAYSIGSWAIANEVYITGLVNAQSRLGAFVRIIYKILHQLPLL